MVTKELIEKYHSGLCTSEEKKKVEEWLKSPSHQVDLSPESEDENTRKEIWSHLTPVISGDSNTPTRPLYRRVIRYAAALIMLCAVGFSVYYFSGFNLTNTENQVSTTYKTVKTQRGEKRTVTLSDGSTIRMNYETEVRVPEKFEGEERVVYLKGHAHFEVTRNPEKPFIVYTEDTKTRVLGTSFDINTKGADETEIIVTS
ncbi:MAG: FecR domain-containing protein, partial [Bacteroidota bacterium]